MKSLLLSLPLAFATFLAPALPVVRGSDPPNIVLVVIDDLGAEAIGCYGGESYATPRIDALARQGMRFENAYAMPACMPSRATLLTGRYAFRSELPFTKTPWVRREGWGKGEITFANLLQEAGYATAISGKWQLSEFDRRPDHLDAHGFTHQNAWGWWHNDVTTRRYWNPTFYRDHQWIEASRDAYGPDLFCAWLIDFMRQQTAAKRPFLAFYPMVLIHHPWPQTPDNRAVPQPGWRPEDNFLEHPNQKWSAANFAAMVAYTDKLVGRIADAIDTLGIADNTLLLVTSDNGTIAKVTSQYRGRQVQGGKMRLKESGTRVPFIARWPGTVPAGSVNENLVDLSDILPTCVALSGAPLPTDRPIDGFNLMGQLKGDVDAAARPWVYARYGDRWFLRTRDFRLSHTGALDDMRTDRYQPTRLLEPGAPRRTLAPPAADAYDALLAAAHSLDHSLRSPRRPRRGGQTENE